MASRPRCCQIEEVVKEVRTSGVSVLLVERGRGEDVRLTASEGSEPMAVQTADAPARRHLRIALRLPGRGASHGSA
jgi:hypothetical protein